jgi:hypothetical protein
LQWRYKKLFLVQGGRFLAAFKLFIWPMDFIMPDGAMFNFVTPFLLSWKFLFFSPD